VRVVLVHNPTAGDEQHTRETLSAALEAEGHDVVYRSTKDDDWQDGLATLGELVVAAGGDGTVRKVFKELAGASVPVTVFPLGTANNIARTLDFHTDDPVELVRSWRSAEHRPFDLGAVRTPESRVAFVEAMGGGIFAEVLEHASDGVEDKVTHGLRVLQEVLENAAPGVWRVEAEGEQLSGEFLALEVLNARETGPNLPLAPDADPGDGRLELVLVRPEHRGPLDQHVQERLAGGQGRPLPFDRHRVRRLELTAPVDCPLRIDEDLWPGAGRHAGSELSVAAEWRLDVLVPDV
jgi:diacylglycerol kinase family enzyme